MENSENKEVIGFSQENGTQEQQTAQPETSAAETAEQAAQPETPAAEKAEQTAQPEAPAEEKAEQTAQTETPAIEKAEQAAPSPAQSAQPFAQAQSAQAQPVQAQSVQAQQSVQEQHYANYGYAGQPVYGGAYPPPFAPQGQFVQPFPEQKKRRFSGAALWVFISVIAAAVIAIIILCVKISSGPVGSIGGIIISGPSGTYVVDKTPEERPAIKLSVAERPQLEDDMYADKDTGLLTTVGVAKVILPSQVQLKIFGDMPYMEMKNASGVIITEDGYIITNTHAIDDGKKFTVKFYDGTEAEARLIGADTGIDIAVLKVDKTGLTPAQLGTSSGLNIGEEVALAGAGGGFCNTVNYGHITGFEKEIELPSARYKVSCIISDAALNSGNSGGALVNMYGQVIGIPVAHMVHSEFENIGFSIAIDDVVPVAEDLISKGYVSTRARIGITYTVFGDEAASGYDVPAGLCVIDFDPNCSVAYSGIEKYDIITHIDGKRMLNYDNITDMLDGHSPGDVVEVIFARKELTGEISTFSVDIKLSDENPNVSRFVRVDEPSDEDGESTENDGNSPDANDAP